MMTDFWRRHPALFAGVTLLIGIGAALSHTWWPLATLVFFFPLSVSGRDLLHFGLAICITAAGYGYGTAAVVSPDWKNGTLKGKTLSGTAVFTPHSIEPMRARTRVTGWLMRGTLNSFQSDDGQQLARNLPCSIRLMGSRRPAANQRYQLPAKLSHVPGMRHSCRLQPVDSPPWHPLPGSWSLADFRFDAKETLLAPIRRSQDGLAADFLGGLLTGRFEERLLQMEFGRFGLQHLLAISGFHFSIVAALLSFLLRWICPFRTSQVLLCALLLLYYIVLGPTASITRAWLMATIALIGFAWGRPVAALNSLGCALVLLLLMRPVAALEVGFQLSFAATAGILLFYRPFENGLQLLFPKRPLSKAVRLSPISQHIYLLSGIWRQLAALTLAVHVTVLPLSLLYFHRFSLSSLLYNLFFPLCVSVLMVLLLPTMLCLFLHPGLGSWLLSKLISLTNFSLRCVVDAPLGLDWALYASDVRGFVVGPIIAVCLWIGILLSESSRDQRQWRFL